jgi:hypothetical protein
MGGVMGGRRIVPVILGVAALSLGAAEPPATSKTYAYATYREVRDRLTVLVDSYPAALHVDDPYIPVAVAVGLSRPGKCIRVSPGSFTLVDEKGRRYRPVPFEEIARNYPKRQFDASLLRSHPIVVGNQFDLSVPIRAEFYPPPASPGLLINRVELDPYTWFRTALYFPRPEGAIHGVLTLELRSEGSEPPVSVRFRIPRVLDRTAS